MVRKVRARTVDRLNRLIASLTPGQRRYVRRWLKRWHPQGQTHALALYEYLLKHPDASHAQIKEYFAGSGWVAQLSVVKYQLYYAILNALAEHMEAMSSSPITLSALRVLYHIHVLIEQKLWQDAVKLLDEAIEKHYRIGNHFVLLGLLHLVLRLHAASEYNLINEQRIARFREMQAWVVADIQEWCSNALAFLMTFSVYKQRGRAGFSNPDTQAIYRHAHQYLCKPSAYASFLNFYLYAQVQLLHAGMQDDYTSVLALVDELHRFVQDEQIQTLYAAPLSSYLLNAMITLTEAGYEEQAQTLLNSLRSLAQVWNGRMMGPALMVQRNYVAALLYRMERTFEATRQVEEPTLRDLQLINRVADQLPAEDWFKAYIYITQAKLAFVQRDLTGALEYLRFFSQEGKMTCARDIHAYAHLIAAIIYYELGDLVEMERCWKRANYYLKKERLVTESVRQLLNFLGRARYRKPRREEWEALREVVDGDKVLNRYFYFGWWLALRAGAGCWGSGGL